MRVTIGIPFYNAEQTLAEAIRSVFAQTYTDLELLLLDDGSSDGSLAIAHAIRDPRVTVLSDGRNLGLARRLNQIAQLANGEYNARFDADDLMHSTRIARQVAFLDANPEYDIVDTGMFTIDKDNTVHGKRFCLPLTTDPVAWLERGVMNHSAVIGRTAWVSPQPL